MPDSTNFNYGLQPICFVSSWAANQSAEITNFSTEALETKSTLSLVLINILLDYLQNFFRSTGFINWGGSHVQHLYLIIKLEFYHILNVINPNNKFSHYYYHYCYYLTKNSSYKEIAFHFVDFFFFFWFLYIYFYTFLHCFHQRLCKYRNA